MRSFSKKKARDIQTARQIISGVVSGKRWRTYLPRAVIWQRWEEIVGEAIAKVAWPWYFHDLDTLIVAVSESIWIQQLSFEAPLLLERINSYLPQNAKLANLRFYVGDVDRIRANTCRVPKNKKNIKKKVKETRKRKIDHLEMRLLDNIEDRELREIFRNILTHLD